MVARVRTVAFHGVDVIDVETQVTIASGLPAFTVVGLPDKAVGESRERVRAALAAPQPPQSQAYRSRRNARFLSRCRPSRSALPGREKISRKERESSILGDLLSG